MGEFLTCQFCGKSDETVMEIVCGYDCDIHNADPNDPDLMEIVCDECEYEHCQDI